MTTFYSLVNQVNNLSVVNQLLLAIINSALSNKFYLVFISIIKSKSTLKLCIYKITIDWSIHV